ncbi:phage tail spike protein [Lactococcus formosensis]|uniref:phage tail spike protein n=1 Tax=Lactococcus formosensis TaxID=1281486 RepID=UPI0024353065|nr:phage tail spike protein [Lactococcus formosensis]MDG6125093.1 phage tail tip lysozyme [Lactococcus formosensis]MDG6148791.1 phage tail tip lysozyme [Lactococcus formosensis]
MANVLFLDKFQKVMKSFDSAELTECIQTREITTNASELMNDSLSLSLAYEALLEEASYIALNDSGEKQFTLYRILKSSDEENILSFENINFAVDELDNFIIKDVRPNNKALPQVINQLLNDSGCDWKLGVCEVNKNITSNFYYSSMREALKALQEFGCEFTFAVEITGNTITRKVINCYNKIGKVTNKRFEYGEDVLKIVREKDRTNIVTAIIGRGKGEEVGDGYGRRLEFTNVEWKKSNGKPLDKPKGQNYLEYPEMTAEYGIPSNGKMLPRKTVVIFEDIEDANELLQKTYETLEYYSRPLVQFSTEVLGADAIGNTVTIHRGDRGYHYQTRVFKVVTNYVTGQVQAGLGDNLSGTSINRQVSNVQNNISDLNQNKMGFYESTEIGKYQDDIMRGAGKNGGSVRWVNGIEAGVSNSREIYEAIFMDGKNIENSKDFLVQNNAGIVFKHCKKGQWKTVQDVHNGAGKTAWTMDGVFNADFIKAGTLEGVKLRSVNNKFIVEISDGKVRFLKNLGNGKEEEMIAFAPVFNVDTNELKGVSLIQNPGFKFSIASNTSSGISYDVLRVPEDSIGKDRKLDLFGDINITGRLLLNGQEVVAGGGSGGGEGEFPPEIVTDQEKNAWIVWQFLKSKGYTEQAAAGILGNMDQESGVMPDTDQVGGPAYGLVQWDGSAYPLVPPATWNGREYVQNLLRAAGISGDYRIAKTQSQLLEWCMFNGQYIASSSYPYSVAQFKGLTDIATATTAFEANFERPAVTHPERVQLAIKWYNKLHGLKPPTPSGSLKEQLDKFYNTYKERYVQNGQCVGLTTAWMATLTANKYGMTPWNSQAYNPDGSPTSGNPRWNYEINIGDGISAATIGTETPPPGWTKIIPQKAEDCKAGDIFYVGTDSGISTGHTGIVYEDGKNGKVPTLDQNFLSSPVRLFDGGAGSSWGLYNWFCIWRKNT